MAEYLELEKVLDDRNIITVQTKEYGSIDVIPVDTITDVPLADVQPVKHGRWKQVSIQVDEYNNHLYECTVCRSTDRHNINVDVPYCWHCGAKMEE